MFFIPTLNTPFHLVSLSPRISCLHSLVNMFESEVKISAFVFACHPCTYHRVKIIPRSLSCFFSLLWELPLITSKPICQESRCQCPATVSTQNTKWMKTGTGGAAMRPAAPLPVPARCRLSARCLRWSPSISPCLPQPCAGLSVTSTLKNSTWKTVTVASVL